MFPILFNIGPFVLHTYGLLVALGIFAAIKICIRQAAADGFTGKEIQESVYQLGFYTVFSGILGARIFYVTTHLNEYAQDWLGIFKIWQGGLVFYGGVIAAVFGFFLWDRQKPFAAGWKRVADWVAPSLALGHAVGRLGCFSAGCCYGKPTDMPWGVTFRDPQSLSPLGISLHPTQIYEFLFLLALCGFLLRRLAKQRRAPRRTDFSVFLEYLLLYSAGRFLIEFFRADEPRHFGLTPGQITSLAVFLVSASWTLKNLLTKSRPIRIINKV